MKLAPGGARIGRTFGERPDAESDAQADDPMSEQIPIFLLNQTPDGLLWVMIAVKDPRYRPLKEGENEDELLSELMDLRYEVIDPEAGEVLVSGLMDIMPAEGDPNAPPIALWIPGTNLSYRSAVDSMGLQTIEFFEMRALRR